MGKIGFIGLGIMGKPMSKNLLKAGYQLVVYNRSRAAVEELVAAGAEAAGSPREVAERCDKFITMLPNSPEVKEVALGPKGLIEGARPGSILIDMSSIDPYVTREIAAELAQKGVRMLDAPVSGSEPKAIQGTLAIMVGGKEEDFAECYPLLKAMGSSVVRVGNIGAGNVAKLANQIIVALNMAAMSEALVLAAKAGVDPELLYQAIRGGLAGSAVLDMKTPMVLAGNFKPGFRINLHIKDLANALAAAHGIGVPLPLTSLVMEIFQSLKVDGLGEADHSAIVRFYEKMAQVKVRKEPG
ncbi:MAG: 2-hydroxy-3-oxopropionate reductase [Thermoanaerobacteraceae bacterium]|nr:2-hydroxy-3-oxopropionate reductase [Thermoanaerobacteraceae bacterium]